jgi:hypothetical protein
VGCDDKEGTEEKETYRLRPALRVRQHGAKATEAAGCDLLPLFKIYSRKRWKGLVGLRGDAAFSVGALFSVD